MILAHLAGIKWHRTSELSEIPSVLPAELSRLRGCAWSARHPETGLPMSIGDLYEVWVGRLDPCLAEETYSDREARHLCERLGLAVQAWLMEQGLVPAAGRTKVEGLLEAAPRSHRDQIWAALMGVSALSGEQLVEDKEALLRLMGAVYGLDRPLSNLEWSRWTAGAPVSHSET
jgi:hypothetical protein